jgi:hypothetical protein
MYLHPSQQKRKNNKTSRIFTSQYWVSEDFPVSFDIPAPSQPPIIK